MEYIIYRVLITLDKVGLESAQGIAKLIKCDVRTVNRTIREFLDPFNLVDCKSLSTGKKEIQIYKISDVYLPIWQGVRSKIEDKVDNTTL